MATLAEDVLTGTPGTPISQTLPERQGVSPEQADVDGFTTTAGPMRRGMRAAPNNIGATLNGIIASSAEALGLNQFAEDRFAEAKRFTNFANSVDHEVRDYGAVKDFNSLIDYVAGNIGKGAVSSLPAIGLAVGLRRPVAGVLAGSFPQEAGEQALTLRDNPNVMASTTPGERLGNAVVKGGINSILELGGAEGQAARRLLKPSAYKGVAKAVAKGTVGEGITEAAQETVGQKLEQQLDPTKEIDPHQIINAGLAGAVGGGAIGGIAQTAAQAPGAIARTVDELQGRLGKLQKPVNPDPESIPEEALKPETTKEQVMGILQKFDDKFQETYGKIKDPAERQAFYEKATQAYYDSGIRPHVKKLTDAYEGAKEFAASKIKKSEQENKPELLSRFGNDILAKKPVNTGVRKNKSEADFLVAHGYQETQPGLWEPSKAKFSEMENKRGPEDDDILDFMSNEMDQDARNSSTPEQLQQLQKLVRNFVENPGDYKHVRSSMKKVFGEKFDKITDYTIERLTSSDEQMKAMKRELKLATMPADDIETHRRELASNIIRTYAKPDYATKPDMRKALLDEMGQRSLDFIEGDADPRFVEAAKESFGANFDKAMNELEQLKDIKPTTSGRAFEGTVSESPREDGDDARLIAEDVTTTESMLAGDPLTDPRLDKVYTGENRKGKDRRETDSSVELERRSKGRRETTDIARRERAQKQAEEGAEALRKEYGPKTLRFEARERGQLGQEGYGEFIVHAEDADQEKLTAEELGRVREPAKYGASGLNNGILIVRTDAHPTGTKLNLKRLTALMMRKEGQQTQEGDTKYVADMFFRGMSQFVNSVPGLRKFVASGKGEDLQVDKHGRWILPDNTPIAVMRDKVYTYGDIKIHKLSRAELRGITSQDILMEEDFLRHTPAGQYHDEILAYLKNAPASKGMSDKDIIAEAEHRSGGMVTDQDFRREAIRRAIERKQQMAEDETYSEPHAQGQDEGIVTQMQTEGSPVSRDAHEKRGYREETGRTLEEDTGRPVGEGGAPALMGNPTRTSPNRGGPTRNSDEAREASLGRIVGDDIFAALFPGIGPVDYRHPKNEKLPRANRQWETDDDMITPATKAGIVKKSEMNNKTVSPEEFGAQLMQKYSYGVTVKLGEYGNSVYLDTLSVQKDMRGKGLGARVMQDIIIYADKVGKGTFLNAMPSKDSDMSLEELEKFYEKFGFKAFDLADREAPGQMTEMYRDPIGTIDEESRRYDATGAERTYGENGQEVSGKVYSTQNVGSGGEASGEVQQSVRDYVKKVLGDKAEVIFKKLQHAGEFAMINDIETLTIAMNSLDPMSVAYHEALHALFERIQRADPKTANILKRAAGSAPIVARLRELLKGHPKALEQLKDPEERLAYMYQFAAAGEKGLIQIGPETRTVFGRVKSFFRKLGAVWSDEMADAMAIERTADILDAFHRGSFSDRNTTAEVLRDKFPMDPEEKARKIMPSLGRFMDKFIWTSAAVLRDTNDPGMIDIANKFHTPTQGGEPGFLQTRHTVFNRFMNRVNDALKGLNNEQLRNVLIEMQSGKEVTSTAAKELRRVLDDAHKYMVDAGVKRLARDPDGKVKYTKGTGEPELEHIGFIENYVPRVPDVEYLQNHKDEFIALLTKHGISNPKKVYEKYSEGMEMGDPREEDYVIGLSYFTPATGARTLNRISDEEMAPFLAKDIVGVMSQYLARASRRGEYTKRFGNSGEVIDKAFKEAGLVDKEGQLKKEAAPYWDAVRAMEGTLGANMSKELKNVYGALTTYQNIRLLPLALFSSFVDPLGIMVRGGTVKEAGSAFVRGIRELAGFKDDDAYQLAKTIGAINTANDAQVIGDMYSSQFMPDIQKRINDKFFRMIGMESYNRSMRVAASAAAEQFVIRHATKPMKDSERYLSELGLTKDDIQIVNDRLVLTDKIKQSMNLWVDQAILRPNAALRPVYMSDPNWILISHLKQYTYMFQKVILARVHHELQHGNYTPLYGLLAYVPMIIASDMLRAALTPSSGDDKKDWDISDWLARGVQRAGFFGPGQFAIDSANDFHKSHFGIESIVGPTGQQLLDFIRASVSPEGSVGREIIKAIPGARLFQ